MNLQKYSVEDVKYSYFFHFCIIRFFHKPRLFGVKKTQFEKTSVGKSNSVIPRSREFLEDQSFFIFFSSNCLFSKSTLLSTFIYVSMRIFSFLHENSNKFWECCAWRHNIDRPNFPKSAIVNDMFRYSNFFHSAATDFFSPIRVGRDHRAFKENFYGKDNWF